MIDATTNGLSGGSPALGALLALVQGITEFLPVSSSGHLRILEHVAGFGEPTTALDVALHLATVLSVLWVYRRPIVGLLRGREEALPAGPGAPIVTARGLRLRPLALNLVIGTIPAGCVGVALGHAVEDLGMSLRVVAVAYALNAGVLMMAHLASRTSAAGPTAARRSLAEMPPHHALLIGVAQAFALFRGVSRSGSTISAALLLGYGAREAAFFSFLLAIPAIGGAVVLALLPVLREGGLAALNLDLGTGLVAFIGTFGVGVVALRVLLASARRAVWWPYAAYSGLLSVLCFALS